MKTIFYRFQTLIYGLKVLKRNYTSIDHMKKIFKSLLKNWRPKITVIQEKNVLALDDIIISLRVMRCNSTKMNLRENKIRLLSSLKSRKVKALCKLKNLMMKILRRLSIT